jgi:hypothetical protein
MNVRSIYNMLRSRQAVSIGAGIITGIAGAVNGAISSTAGHTMLGKSTTMEALSEAATVGAISVGVVSAVGGAALAYNASYGIFGNFEKMQKNYLKYLDFSKYGVRQAFNDYVRTHRIYFGTHFFSAITASTLLRFMTNISFVRLLFQLVPSSLLTGLVLAPVTAVGIAKMLDHINTAYHPQIDKDEEQQLLLGNDIRRRPYSRQ